MLFTQDRVRLRGFYRATLQKARAGETLDALEQLVADVIAEHPEYHSMIADQSTALEADFQVEDGQINPWLHLSMHIALREQVGTDHPQGIADITRSLLLKHQDGHSVEHLMFECLGQALWSAQRNHTSPDEAAYLACLRGLLSR